MAGYPEDNQHALNGYEEEEEVEEVEEVDEEEGHPGRRGRRDGGDGGGYGDVGGDDGRAGGGDSSGKIFVGGVAWETTEGIRCSCFSLLLKSQFPLSTMIPFLLEND